MEINTDTAQKGLAEFRVKHGHTLEKLSDKTGVSIPTIVAIEKGHSKPQATTIYKLNKYLSTFK